MRFRFIEEHRHAFCAKRMCDMLGVSLSQPPCQPKAED